MKPYVVDGRSMFKRMAITLVAGMFVSAAAIAVGYRVNEVEPAAQKVALSVCPMPKTEGEMTIYVIEGGAIKCWRWR